MSQIFARRLGRIAFGLVLLIGLASVVTAVWSGPPSPRGTSHLGAARLVGATWLAAAIAGGLVRAIAGRFRWSQAPDALFAESMMIPTAGIALLLPITLHLPVVLLASDAAGFDFWVMASLWITGLAHLMFAGLCVLRAHQLVAGKTPITPRRIYVATLITSCVPFVLLWAIPPTLVAITALPFMPMLHAMQRRVERERVEVDAVTRALPRAIALASRRA